MEERIARIEAQLQELSRSLAGVEARLAALEGQEAGGRPDLEDDLEPAGDGVLEPAGDGAIADRVGAAGLATLLGRTFLVFGGAYLLRAVTDAGLVPQAWGVVLGLAYALSWLLAADRGAARQRRLSATFHGVTGILIALPILWEATARFGLLAAGTASLAIAVVAAGALGVAARRRLPVVAWWTAAGAAGAALALVRSVADPSPLVALLLALGLGTLWLTYAREWPGLRWLGAAAAALGLAILLVGLLGERVAADPVTAVALLTVYFTGYLASFAGRTLLQHRQVGVFEIVQTALGLGLGFVGAVRAGRSAGLDVALLAVLGLLLGLGSYAVAFAPPTRHERRRNFFFYTFLALVLVLLASQLLLPAPPVALAWGLAAVACAWLSGRFSRVTLSLQASLYLLAAAFAGGLVRLGRDALLTTPDAAWPHLSPWHLAALASVLLCLAMPVAKTSQGWRSFARLPPLVVLLLAAWGVGGVVVAFLAPIVASVPGPAADLGLLAVLRTAVLALAAVLAAWAGRSDRFREASWLVYPFLILLGLKLIAEDFPRGRPLTLFAALALAGIALIATARLAHKDPQATAGDPGAPSPD